MDELKVTKIDLTEISLDALDGVEASGGNWKRIGKYVYKIVAVKSKCAYEKKYVEGANPYSGKRVADCCSSCKYLLHEKGYWLCEATKRTEV